MKMTVELFDSIINTSQDCVFWKDSDRRFLGVNQAFLDFYGFESADVLIGKTDEDMGWHSDPEPFRQDELRVLSGRSTYKVQGKCMIRGEERDIIASKRPLYDGDKIIGLVGSFIDITDVIRRRNGLDSVQIVYTIDKLRKFGYFDRVIDEISLDEILDPLTGVLSRSYSMKFVNSLIADRIPFTFTMIDKMLYLGKSRGRDCYTIYREDKHKNIEIQQLAKRGIFNEMQSLNLRLKEINGFENKLKAAMNQLAEILQIKDLYYVKKDGRMRAVMDPAFEGDARDIDSLMIEDVFSERTLDRVKAEAPVFYATLKANRLNSALVMRFEKSSYLVCAVERNYRIWQENECAILYYLAGLLD